MTGGRLLISGVTVVDGRGAPAFGPINVLIEDRRIVEIGADVSSEDAERLDGAGRFLIPGLWETEGHLVRYSNGLLADMRLAWPEEGDIGRVRSNLAAYLASGVTAVLDLGGPTEILAELREEQRRGEVRGARLFFTGRQFTAIAGQPALDGKTLPGLTTQVGDAEAARRKASEMIETHRIDAVKANYTVGGGPFGLAPVLQRDTLEALVEVAHENGLPILAHIDSAELAADALEAGVDNVEHIFDPDPSSFDRDVERVTRLCLENGAFWPMTLVLWEAFSRAGDETMLAEIGVDGRVEPRVLAELRETPESLWNTLPPDWRRYYQARFEAGMSVVADVLAEGVKMTVATDAGNPMVFHGPSVLREMVLMQRAGVEPLEILRAATSRAAEKLNRADVLGTVAVGKVADLVLLDADPLADIANVGEIAAVIQEGTVLRPDSLAL
ncbi:MAG TPA: amidohydrolase family protein [Solirubrobacterales bacterium]|nr:amidohydrolase family protein [Solirubrobacterales bacterium]